MPKPPKGTLPAFIPVPRLMDRHNGWKPEVQRAFIEALADTGSVEAACRRVNRASVGAYALRRHPAAGEFRNAWEAALAIGVQRIEDVAMERALNGVEVPVYSYGKLIGTRIIYNDRLLMFILRNRAPKRFAAGQSRGLNAVDNMRLKRLKKAWHKEWREEQQASAPKPDDVRASILRKLEAMDAAERLRWTPREHELTELLEAERAARKDREKQEVYARYRRDNHGRPHWEEREDAQADETEWADADETCGDHAEPDDAWEPDERPGLVDLRTRDEAEEEGREPPDRPGGPRVRTLKDERWRGR